MLKHTPSSLVSPDSNPIQTEGRGNVWVALRRQMDRGVLGLEINPFTNGPLRYGGAVAVGAVTKNPEAGIAYLAASTVALEGYAGVVMSKVIDRSESKILGKIGNVMDKLKVPKGRDLPLAAKVAITNYLGVPTLVFAEQRADESRTVEQNKILSWKAASCLAVGCAIQGKVAVEGATNITNPLVAAPAIIGLGALTAGLKRIKNRFLLK